MNKLDQLWPGGPVFRQQPSVFPIGTDAVLLAAFAPTAYRKKICDLGCGGGVLAILTALESQAQVDALDIQADAVALARENVVLNGLTQRISVRQGDLRQIRSLYPGGAYDLVLANPPYFPTGSGRPAETAEIATARDERSCTLADVAAAAAYLTRWGGSFCLCHKPERLAEVICTLSASGLEPKRLRLVAYQAHLAPNLVLLEARRGGKPGLAIQPTLCLCNPDGSDTQEIKEIYRRP